MIGEKWISFNPICRARKDSKILYYVVGGGAVYQESTLIDTVDINFSP